MIGGTDADMEYFKNLMDLEDLIYPKAIGVWIQLSLRGEKVPLKRSIDDDDSDTDADPPRFSSEGSPSEIARVGNAAIVFSFILT